MQKARKSFFVASHAGRLWAIGGSSPEGDLADVEVYDPEVDLWSNWQIPMQLVKGRIAGCTFSCEDFNHEYKNWFSFF